MIREKPETLKMAKNGNFRDLRHFDFYDCDAGFPGKSV